jgi:hypothetical protein
MALNPHWLPEPPALSSSSNGMTYGLRLGIFGFAVAPTLVGIGYQLEPPDAAVRGRSAPRDSAPQLADRPSDFDQQRLAADEPVPLMQTRDPQQSSDALSSRAEPERLTVASVEPRQENQVAFERVGSPPVGNSAAKSQSRRLDVDAIAAMVKRGAEYLEDGNVVAARMILQPAAEAGDAADETGFMDLHSDQAGAGGPALRRLTVASAAFALASISTPQDLPHIVSIARHLSQRADPVLRY